MRTKGIPVLCALSLVAIVLAADDPKSAGGDGAGFRKRKDLQGQPEKGWPITDLVFSADGKTLAAANHFKVRLWQVDSGKPLADFLGKGGEQIMAVRFLAGGKHVVSVSNRSVRVWDWAKGAEIRKLPGRHTVELSRDGKRLLAATEGGCGLWRTDNWKLVRAFKLPPHRTLALSPDGTMIAVGERMLPKPYPPNYPAAVTVLAAETGKELARFAGFAYRIVFSPESKRLAVVQEGVALWSLAGKKRLRAFKAGRLGCGSAAFSPDGRLIVAGGGYDPAMETSRGALAVWDVATGSLLATLPVREGKKGCEWVNSVAFSADSRCLAACDSQGAVRIWQVPAPAPKPHAKGGQLEAKAIPFQPIPAKSIAYVDDSWVTIYLVADDAVLKLMIPLGKTRIKGKSVVSIGPGKGKATLFRGKDAWRYVLPRGAQPPLAPSIKRESAVSGKFTCIDIPAQKTWPHHGKTKITVKDIQLAFPSGRLAADGPSTFVLRPFPPGAATPATPTTQPEEPTDRAARIAWGKATDGVVCGVALDRERYLLGQNVQVSVFLRNTLDRALTCNVGTISSWRRIGDVRHVALKVDTRGGKVTAGVQHRIPAGAVRKVYVRQFPTRPALNYSSDLHFVPARTPVVIVCTPMFSRKPAAPRTARSGRVVVEVVNPLDSQTVGLIERLQRNPWAGWATGTEVVRQYVDTTKPGQNVRTILQPDMTYKVVQRDRLVIRTQQVNGKPVRQDFRIQQGPTSVPKPYIAGKTTAAELTVDGAKVKCVLRESAMTRWFAGGKVSRTVTKQWVLSSRPTVLLRRHGHGQWTISSVRAKRRIAGREYLCIETQSQLSPPDAHVVITRCLHPDVPGHLVEEIKEYYKVVNAKREPAPWMVTHEKTSAVRVPAGPGKGGEQALLAAAAAVRGKHPRAGRAMWDAMAALIKPGMTVAMMKRVLPEHGTHVMTITGGSFGIVYKLDDRADGFDVVAFGAWGGAKPGDPDDKLVLNATPRIKRTSLKVIQVKTVAVAARAKPPGTILPIRQVVRGGVTFIAICEALNDAKAVSAAAGVRQEFKVQALLCGTGPAAKTFHVTYHRAANASSPDRPIRKGHKVIWIVRGRDQAYQGAMALAYTPENPKNHNAVLEALLVERTAGKAVGGLKLTLRAAKAATVLRGGARNAEPVPLAFTFTNVGDKPIKLETSDHLWPRVYLHVTGPDGKRVRFTELMIERIGPIKVTFSVLQPGKSVTHGRRFPGQHFGYRTHDPLQPGAYRIWASYPSSNRGRASNEITLTVQPAPAAGKPAGTGEATELDRQLVRLRHSNYNDRRLAAQRLGDLGDKRAAGPLAAALTDENQWVRRWAAYALGRLGDRRAVEPLVAAMADESALVRAAAARALAEFGDRRAFDPLRTSLKETDSAVRTLAAAGLGRLGDKRAVALLIAALGDRDDRVRRAAAKALGLVRDPRAFEPLLAAMKDKDQHVRLCAIVALGIPKDKRAVEPFLAALKDGSWSVRRDAADGLGHLGDRRAVRPLIGALTDKWEPVRAAAARSLGNLGDKAAVEPLIAALTDKAVMVRALAAEALNKLADARAAAALLRVIEDEHSPVRRAAMAALGALRHPRAARPIIAFLADGRNGVTVKRQAVDGLVKIGPPAVGPLIAAMGHRDYGVGTMAAEALARIRPPAVTPLIAALADESSWVRACAADALGNLRDRRAVGPLIAAMADTKWQHRHRAALALGRLGDRRAVEPLLAAAKGATGPLRTETAVALSRLGDRGGFEPLVAALTVRGRGDTMLAMGRMDTSDDRSRCMAAEGLGRLGDKRALKPLVAALTDKRRRVRAAAAEALGELHDLRALDHVLGALMDDDHAVRTAAARALGRLGDRRAVGPLLTALGYRKDSSVPCVAAEALGVLRDPRALDPLVAMLKDPNGFLRRASARALGELGDRRAVVPLIAALTGGISVPASAAAALGELGDARAVEPLLKVLTIYVEWPIRHAAAEALKKIRVPSHRGGAQENDRAAPQAATDPARDGAASAPPALLRIEIGGRQPADAPVIFNAKLTNMSGKDLLGRFDSPSLLRAFLTGPDARTRRVCVTNGARVEGSFGLTPTLKPGQTIATPLRLTRYAGAHLHGVLPSEHVYLPPGKYRLRLDRLWPGPNPTGVMATAEVPFTVVGDAVLARSRFTALRGPANKKRGRFAEHVLTTTLTPAIRRQWYQDIKDPDPKKAVWKTCALCGFADPPPDVMPAIVAALNVHVNNPNVADRDLQTLLNNAALAIGKHRPSGAGGALLKLATGTFRSSERGLAILALRHYYRREMADRIAALLKDKDKWIPLYAAHLLAWAGDDRGANVLIAGAKAKNPSSAAALAYLTKHKAATETLKKALALPDPEFVKKLKKAMATQPPRRSPEARAKLSWGDAVEGLQCGIAPDKAVYTAAEDPRIAIALRNVSDKKIACVLPNAGPGSDFPALLSFTFRRRSEGRWSSYANGAWLKLAKSASPNPNRGANEYAVAAKDKVFRATFFLRSLVTNRGKALQLAPGEYSVSVTYFIPASTRKHATRRPEGATLWANHHLRSGAARFRLTVAAGKRPAVSLRLSLSANSGQVVLANRGRRPCSLYRDALSLTASGKTERIGPHPGVFPPELAVALPAGATIKWRLVVKGNELYPYSVSRGGIRLLGKEHKIKAVYQEGSFGRLESNTVIYKTK